MIEWFVQTLRTYPEIATLSLALAITRPLPTSSGRCGNRNVDCRGIIGQLGIKITGPLKLMFFPMFLLSAMRGDRIRPRYFLRRHPALFAAVVCVFCLRPRPHAKMAGYDGRPPGCMQGLGHSASMGLRPTPSTVSVRGRRPKKLLMPCRSPMPHHFSAPLACDRAGPARACAARHRLEAA
jgi:putative transport protein